VDQGSLELWVVDDAKEALEIPYYELGGTDFAGVCREKVGPLLLLRSQSSKASGPEIEALRDPEDLISRVDEGLLKRKREMPVLVIDILFEKLPGKTGLDIISEVRRRAQEHVVVIAHTGYGSPLVSWACHHEGADFVVQKAGRAVGSHAAVTAEGGAMGAREDRLTSWMEVFWNTLSLQAAYRFGNHYLAHLSAQIEKPVASGPSDTDWLGQAWRDLESVMRPHSSVHFRESWRGSVFDLLCDSAHFVSAARGADGLDAELRRWKREIVVEAKRLQDEVS
jgi:ActR/RegA family two-component response regulator